MEIADLHLVVAVLLAEILVVDHQVLMEVEAVVLVLLCALLLRCTALLTAPLSTVLEWLASWLAQPGSDGQLPPAPPDDAPDRAAWWSTLPWPLPAHHAQEAADAFDPIAEMGKLTLCWPRQSSTSVTTQ